RLAVQQAAAADQQGCKEKKEQLAHRQGGAVAEVPMIHSRHAASTRPIRVRAWRDGCVHMPACGTGLIHGEMSMSQDLRKVGLKVTHPRLRILELLEHAKPRHMTAEDIYRQLLAESEEIGLATIY